MFFMLLHQEKKSTVKLQSKLRNCNARGAIPESKSFLPYPAGYVVVKPPLLDCNPFYYASATNHDNLDTKIHYLGSLEQVTITHFRVINLSYSQNSNFHIAQLQQLERLKNCPGHHFRNKFTFYTLFWLQCVSDQNMVKTRSR